LDDAGAGGVVAVRVLVVGADEVEADGAVVIGIGFPVRDGVELGEGFAPAGVEDAEEEFVGIRVVVGWFGEGDAVVGVIGEAETEAVGLDAVVGGAEGAWGV